MLEQLMAVSIYGSVIIGIAYLARLFVGRHIPRRILVLIWEIATLRLLLPDILHREFSLWQWVALPKYPYAIANSTKSPLISENLLRFIWLYVALSMGVYFVCAYFWQKRKLKPAQPISEDRIKSFREMRKEAEKKDLCMPILC